MPDTALKHTAVINGPAGHWYALTTWEGKDALMGLPQDRDEDITNPPAHPDTPEGDWDGWCDITDPAPETDVDALAATIRGIEAGDAAPFKVLVTQPGYMDTPGEEGAQSIPAATREDAEAIGLAKVAESIRIGAGDEAIAREDGIHVGSWVHTIAGD